MLSWALELLPESIEEVMIHSDSAGHAAEVLKLCNRPELRPAATRRFGVIGFAISAVRSQELMAAVVPEADWTPLRVLEKREPEGGGKPVLVEVDSAIEAIAEVNFVSNEDGYSKREGIVRYIAVRRNRRLRRRGCRMRWASTMTNCHTTTGSRPMPSAC